jgi:hypothetical protein
MSEGRAAEVLKPANRECPGALAIQRRACLLLTVNHEILFSRVRIHNVSHTRVDAVPMREGSNKTSCYERTPDAMQPNRHVELSPCASR